MLIVRRMLNCAVVLLLGNIVFWWQLPVPALVLVGAAVLLVGFFMVLNIIPSGEKGLPRKLKGLGRGCELLLTAVVCTVLQVGVCVLVGFGPGQAFPWYIWLANCLVAALLLYILLVNGAIRLFVASGQLSTVRRILMVCLCWIPVANLAIFFIAWPVARREYRFRCAAHRRDAARAALQVCQTRYPLLLVHGIFFRDWKLLNYWGRIPDALQANGATLYYGQQQSSAAVNTSAEELKARILQIVEQTGCEKVNIIAHSKGGLDSRYAISCLGMGQHVASLTTINTPHRGCRFAKRALDNVPQNIVSLVTKDYNKVFTVLGDKQPDFFSGVSELTDARCEELNALMPDCGGVLYQSIGSCMSTAGSSGFPLNLGYGIINTIDGANDGLVAVGSMPWGEFTMVQPSGKKGISHADMIDLTLKDVNGFDVCELYVQLVSGLKARGL